MTVHSGCSVDRETPHEVVEGDKSSGLNIIPVQEFHLQGITHSKENNQQQDVLKQSRVSVSDDFSQTAHAKCVHSSNTAAISCFSLYLVHTT